MFSLRDPACIAVSQRLGQKVLPACRSPAGNQRPLKARGSNSPRRATAGAEFFLVRAIHWASGPGATVAVS